MTPLQCDSCGRFIAWDDFEKGARRVLITPDSDYSCEDYETFCVNCQLALSKREIREMAERIAENL